MTHALTRFRQANEMTLEAFGDQVGATKGMVSKWETGKAFPRKQFIARIFDVTNGAVTANDFAVVYREAAE